MDGIDRTYHCDVLVIGSGVSGYCAAIQAGRCGAKTILIEKDEVLGGNSGPNLGVGITGADRYNDYAGETGIIQELQEEGCWIDAITHVSPGSMGYTIHRRFEAVVQEHLKRAGVTILKRHCARRPIMDGDRIAAVVCEDSAAFQTARIDVGGFVIEGSGDGEIAALAGAEFDFGSESRDEFGERSAPEQRTNQVQGTSLVAIAHPTGRDIRFVPPAGTPEHVPRVWHGRMSSWLSHHDGWFAPGKDLFFLYVTETGGHMDTVRDDGDIYEMLLRQLWAEWDHIKNGPHAEEAREWDLLWVSPKAGKRESRRFIGDYVLTQTDVEDGVRFADDITYGGHDLDDHMPLGEGSNIFAHSIPPLFGVPYRCCYSRNLSNLFLAGRLISATHIAHSSTRIMRTGAAIGQAVGLAASLCLEHHCTPRALDEEHIDELQQSLIARDATILGVRREDSTDLARSATASASSEVRFNDQEPGTLVPLIARAGVVLWDWPENLNTVSLFLRNDSDQAQELRLRILRARREGKWIVPDDWHQFHWNDLRDEAFAEIHSATAELPAGHHGWFEIDLASVELGEKDAASDDDRVLIALDQNANVSWAVATRRSEIATMVEHSHHRPQWASMNAMATMRLDPAPSVGEATNAINGHHRRTSRAPLNMWMSDPEAGLPQELILEWPEAQSFDQVTVTFDNLARLTSENPWHSGSRVVPFLAKAYDISVWADGEWAEVVSEDDNFHRRRTHRVGPIHASKLRLRVLSTHGEGFGARVYELSVHDAQK